MFIAQSAVTVGFDPVTTARVDKYFKCTYSAELSDVRASAEYKELQTRCARQSDDLASHVRTITDLEREKSDLDQGRLNLVLLER